MSSIDSSQSFRVSRGPAIFHLFVLSRHLLLQPSSVLSVNLPEMSTNDGFAGLACLVYLSFLLLLLLFLYIFFKFILFDVLLLDVVVFLDGTQNGLFISVVFKNQYWLFAGNSSVWVVRNFEKR